MRCFLIASGEHGDVLCFVLNCNDLFLPLLRPIFCQKLYALTPRALRSLEGVADNGLGLDLCRLIDVLLSESPRETR